MAHRLLDQNRALALGEPLRDPPMPEVVLVQVAWRFRERAAVSNRGRRTALSPAELNAALGRHEVSQFSF
jgi:hypothetical protein